MNTICSVLEGWLTEKDITLIHMEQVDAVTAFIANQGDFASLAPPSSRRSWKIR